MEYLKLAITGAIAVLITWLVTKGTDTYDAGSEADIRRIAAEVVQEHQRTDSGQPIKAVLAETRSALSDIRANQRVIDTKLAVIINAVEVLSEE